MQEQRNCLRVGIAALLCAIVFRFFTPGILIALRNFLLKPETVAFLIYAETGRRVKISPAGEALPEEIQDAFLTFAPESPPPVREEPVLPVFSRADRLAVDYACSYRPDLQSLLTAPLSWNLRADHPTVLIYHTHTTESYRKFSQDYEETAAYRTLNPQYSIVAVGERIRELLEAEGISVIHDREVHDYPSYNASYLNSRLAVQKLLNLNEGILLALDLHRDAVEGPDGRQMKTEANLGGSTSAQLMIIVGTDCRLKHKNWEKNLALGLKLQAQLETSVPGLARPLCLRPQRFNQDLSPGALLIEVGSAGNSLGEAMLAGEQLAKAIIALAGGTATADSEGSVSDPPAVPADGF